MHAIIEDMVPVAVPDASFERRLARVVVPFGWTELAASTWDVLERCAAAPRHRWPGLVDEWLREIADRAALAVAEIELLGDVRELLRVKLVPALPSDERNGLVCVPAGRYFDALVVVDHPKYGAPLTRNRADLLQLGDLGYVVPRTHERELSDIAPETWPLSSRDSAMLFRKPGSPYVSALLTELGRLLPDPHPFGALVGVPSYDTMLLYPIGSRAVLDLLPAFTDTVAGLHAGADDPCSAEVFWWHSGDLSALSAPPARKALRTLLRGHRRRRP
ncbi:hypothetical protein [Marinitenerispora sediminis]|uniref:Uncharacterized protein n=1 Tax=Marinitenerispora sediminis TaxID=1931232 RepID=A0A368SZB9_9ACTN|nr:hypothetical protein [Marinitenerispora sediminis]RCV50989.1 hypothetical protein DEF24_23660 [Marinitenerispora sediminis]RCV51963.1 hypothetical protein DEF28_14245 [Marinitenerispora sediminis]RCV55405.1 hypothetical protein DEF23_14385 [Marinitenerispora sediminis]